MKFTNEKLIEMVDNAESCGVHLYGASLVGDLAKEFLVERTDRDKNPGVWDGAPEWADRVRLEYGKANGDKCIYTGKTYTRTLPKTKAREIAEKWAGVPTPTPTRPYLADMVESAINEALDGGGK